ncbi:MAG: hypothetical protein ACLFSB_02325 [Chitinispirillaceae bacterium]
MEILPGLTVIPIIHGRYTFAAHARAVCGSSTPDIIAVDIPAVFQDDIGAAVDELPYISALTATGAQGTAFYVPIDPCDPTIEAIRQARQRRIPYVCIGHPHLREPSPVAPLPDEHALERIGFDAYASLCLRLVGNPDADSPQDKSARYTATQLLNLMAKHGRVLAFVHMATYARTVFHLHREISYNRQFEEPPAYQIRRFLVYPDHLYFALGELPFVVGKAEQERQNIFGESINIPDCIKDLFRDTRENYSENSEEINQLSPSKIRIGLTFLRNLTIGEYRLIPSLFDIVTAAKGVGGNTYALRVLKNAKYYPYLPLESDTSYMGVGIDRVRFPDGSIFDAVNLFRDTAIQWQTIPIKPDANTMRKKTYRFQWDPFKMCSHVPEDKRIEQFNSHVRSRAMRILSEDHIKTEQFTTSVKDGIDIRDTLRNWYTRRIYVKELPFTRAQMDTVIIIFDENHDDRYPQQATWYAEHDQESTLSFYATDPFDNMVGPGIARSLYGGLSLLFPPKPIPNLFEITQTMQFRGLSHQLSYGAMLYSKESAVGYICARKPDLTLRMMARRLNKRLVWIPLSSFSSETIQRLRRFHVLNGKEVRSWATRFIGH